MFCGIPDPAETRQELAAESDSDAAMLRQLIAAWEDIDPSGNGITVADALKRAREAPGGYPTFTAVVTEIVPEKKDPVRTLRCRLRKFRRRVCGGRYLDRETREHVAV